MAATVLAVIFCIFVVLFFGRFFVALCQESKRPTLAYLVRIEPRSGETQTPAGFSSSLSAVGKQRDYRTPSGLPDQRPVSQSGFHGLGSAQSKVIRIS